jgi:hypothetical protein
MQLLAYIFFVITALFFIGLAMLTVSEPSRGGDSSMGYGWGAIILSLGFTLSSLILLLIVRSKGGLDWVAHEAGTRTALLIVFWLAMAITTFFGQSSNSNRLRSIPLPRFYRRWRLANLSCGSPSFG